MYRASASLPLTCRFPRRLCTSTANAFCIGPATFCSGIAAMLAPNVTAARRRLLRFLRSALKFRSISSKLRFSFAFFIFLFFHLNAPACKHLSAACLTTAKLSYTVQMCRPQSIGKELMLAAITTGTKETEHIVAECFTGRATERECVRPRGEEAEEKRSSRERKPGLRLNRIDKTESRRRRAISKSAVPPTQP